MVSTRMLECKFTYDPPTFAGFCYVTYVNGGHEPHHLIDQVRDCCYRLMKFNVFTWVASRVRLIINWFNYQAFSKIHLRQ